MPKSSTKIIVLYATLTLVLFLSTFIEFDKFSIKYISLPLLWLTVAIIGIKSFKSLRGTNSVILKSILGLGFAAYVFITLFSGTRYIICSEINHGIKYINKENSSISLVCKAHECYGTSGKCDLYKVTAITANINWVTKNKATVIDPNIWQPVSLANQQK